jgi:hypothetical protein
MGYQDSQNQAKNDHQKGYPSQPPANYQDRQTYLSTRVGLEKKDEDKKTGQK